jgi:hypothetical protein
VVAELEGVGRVVLTRVLGRDGRERMEITGSAYLPKDEQKARRRLQATLDGFMRVLQSS